MKEEDRVELEFKEKLLRLLNEYDAYLEAEDHWQGYTECGCDIRMTVYIPPKFDVDGELLNEYIEIDLGSIQP